MSLDSDLSEYHVPPRRMLLHHPRHGAVLERLSADKLAEHNFLALPHPEEFYAEYDAFAALIGVLVFLLIVELLNTGLEKLADVVTRDHHPGIGWVKDMGSAAVALSLLLAGLVWLVALAERLGLI